MWFSVLKVNVKWGVSLPFEDSPMLDFCACTAHELKPLLVTRNPGKKASQQPNNFALLFKCGR